MCDPHGVVVVLEDAETLLIVCTCLVILGQLEAHISEVAEARCFAIVIGDRVVELQRLLVVRAGLFVQHLAAITIAEALDGFRLTADVASLQIEIKSLSIHAARLGVVVRHPVIAGNRPETIGLRVYIALRFEDGEGLLERLPGAGMIGNPINGAERGEQFRFVNAIAGPACGVEAGLQPWQRISTVSDDMVFGQ